MKRPILASAAALLVAVATTATAADQEVASAVAQHLRSSGQLKDFRIGVKYEDGTAWLRGTVTDAEQMATAMRLVRDLPQVDRVVNQLTVTNDSSGSAVRQVEMRQPVVNPIPAPRRQQIARQAAAEQMGAAPAQLRAPTATPISNRSGGPMPMSYSGSGGPVPEYAYGGSGMVAPVSYDEPHLPNYAWPTYAAYPNYAGLTYPQQYSPTAWPYIGPFYPYPQVPLGWRKVTLEWDDGWWMLDFKDRSCHW